MLYDNSFRITGKLKFGRADNLAYDTRGGHNHNDLELQNLTGLNHSSYHEDNFPLPVRRSRVIRQNSSDSQNAQNSSPITNSVFARFRFFGGRQDSFSGSR